MNANPQEQNSAVLPPQELHTFKVLGVPIQERLDDIPGQIGLFGLILRGMPRRTPLLRWPAALVGHGMFQIANTLHSVGHILSAQNAGAPVDAIVLTHGRQWIRYLNHHVTPEQHIGRAVGGPLMSGAQAALGYVLWRILRHVPLIGGLLGGVARMWCTYNAIILGLSLGPSPSLDGGVLLKWGVTLRTGEEALGDETVRQAGFATVGALFMAAGWFLLRGKVLIGAICLGCALYVAADLMGGIRKLT